MKTSIRSFLPAVTFCSILLGTSLAAAAPIKTYQVTGPVLEVTDTTITIEKDKEKWQMARDKDTKINGDLKPGAKATIQYRMSATTVDVKGDAKADTKAETKGEAKADKAEKPAREKPAKK